MAADDQSTNSRLREDLAAANAQVARLESELAGRLGDQQPGIHRSHEKALQTSEERLDLVLEGTANSMWDFDLVEGKIVRSKQLAKILGYEPTEIAPTLEAWRELTHPDDRDRVHKLWLAHLEGRTEYYQVELRKRTKDGSWCWLLDRGKVVERSNTGVPLRAVGTTRDINEQKLAVEALRKSEEFNRAVIELSPLGISVRDGKGKLLSYNKEWQRIWAIPDDDIALDMHRDRVNLTLDKRDDYLGPWRDQVAKIYREGGVLSIPELKTHERRPGSAKWVSNYFYAIRSDTGSVDRVVVLTEDITERKEAQDILQASEERYRYLFEHMGEGLATADANDVIIFANPAAEQIFGVGPGMLVGRHLSEFVKGEEMQYVQRLTDVRKRGDSSTYELRIHRPDGAQRLLTITGSPEYDSAGNFRGGIGIIRDVTERRRAQEELRQEKEFSERILDTVKDTIFIFDPVTKRALRWNKAFRDVCGYTDEEIAARLAPDDWYSPEDLERSSRALQQVFETGQAMVELSLVSKDGSRIPTEYRAGVIKDATGDTPCLIAVGRDITERKLAEQALRESEEKFRTVVTEAPAITFAIDNDGVFTLSEGKGLAALGLEPGQVVGVSALEMYQDFPDVISGIKTALAGEVFRGVIDLGGVIFEIFCSPQHDVDGQVDGLIGMAIDVTERKRLEDQIRQTQKMEAIGTLAGGIAHDFNNILFAIQGNAEIAKESLADSPEMHGILDEIITAGKRAAELVKQLLAFGRPTAQKRSAVSLPAIIGEVQRMARATLPATITIDCDVQSPNAHVLADPTEMHQILLNLCTNAGQSMLKTGGLLKIGLRESELDGIVLSELPELKPGSYAQLSVSDTGIGMDPEIQSRVFEPFFTTREIGEGSGMGLAVVHGLVNALNGAISIDSESGQGATFNIYLPMVEAPEVKVTTADPVDIRGSEHILLVDDEPQLVKMLCGILNRLGYQTSAFTDSEKALDAVERDPQLYDIVISDQTMPNLTGSELAKSVTTIRPDLPVILVTGFSQTLSQEEAMETGVSEYLMKPVTKQDLGETIRRALDNKT